MSRSANAAVVLALACVTATATAAAQLQLPRARFGIGGGGTAPQGVFREDANGDGFNSGWEGMAFLEFRESRRPLGLRVDVVIGENPANDQFNADATAVNGQPTTLKMRMFGVNADLVYGFRASRRGAGGYVLGGVGSYRLTLTTRQATGTGDLATDQSENKFAWNAGGGVTLPVGRAAVFVEARYINISTAFAVSKLPIVAVTAGLRFGH